MLRSSMVFPKKNLSENNNNSSSSQQLPVHHMKQAHSLSPQTLSNMKQPTLSNNSSSHQNAPFSNKGSDTNLLEVPSFNKAAKSVTFDKELCSFNHELISQNGMLSYLLTYLIFLVTWLMLRRMFWS